MNKHVTLPSPGELRQKIDALRKSHGYLLPHHGAMAAGAPDLFDGYMVMYRALTLNERYLDPFEKEFVWLCILIAMKEAVGTHHVELFFKAGGTQEQAQGATRLTAIALGARAFGFMSQEWPEHFPSLVGTKAYIDSLNAALSGFDLPADLIAMASTAVHTAIGDHWGTAASIEAAYLAQAPEEKLVEAMSFVMWPAGINPFVHGCGIWHQLMASGRVTPSERFRVWAETPAQGGHSDRARSKSSH